MRLIDADAYEFPGDLINEPTINPDDLRPHGWWIINPDGYYPYCSECKGEPKHGEMTKYCPNCGAKMDREEMQGFTREEYVAYENELKRYSTPTGISVFDAFSEMDGKENEDA